MSVQPRLGPQTRPRELALPLQPLWTRLGSQIRKPLGTAQRPPVTWVTDGTGEWGGDFHKAQSG